MSNPRKGRMTPIDHDGLPAVDEAAVRLPADPQRRAAVLAVEQRLLRQGYNRWVAREEAVYACLHGSNAG